MRSIVRVMVPPLLYLTALERRHKIFSVNQCLSEIMSRHILGGKGFTMISSEDFKCLLRINYGVDQ
jgi:hypothetical protein